MVMLLAELLILPLHFVIVVAKYLSLELVLEHIVFHIDESLLGPALARRNTFDEIAQSTLIVLKLLTQLLDSRQLTALGDQLSEHHQQQVIQLTHLEI